MRDGNVIEVQRAVHHVLLMQFEHRLANLLEDGAAFVLGVDRQLHADESGNDRRLTQGLFDKGRVSGGIEDASRVVRFDQGQSWLEIAVQPKRVLGLVGAHVLAGIRGDLLAVRGGGRVVNVGGAPDLNHGGRQRIPKGDVIRHRGNRIWAGRGSWRWSGHCRCCCAVVIIAMNVVVVVASLIVAAQTAEWKQEIPAARSSDRRGSVPNVDLEVVAVD